MRNPTFAAALLFLAALLTFISIPGRSGPTLADCRPTLAGIVCSLKP